MPAQHSVTSTKANGTATCPHGPSQATPREVEACRHAVRAENSLEGLKEAPLLRDLITSLLGRCMAQLAAQPMCSGHSNQQAHSAQNKVQLPAQRRPILSRPCKHMLKLLAWGGDLQTELRCTHFVVLFTKNSVASNTAPATAAHRTPIPMTAADASGFEGSCSTSMPL